MLNVFTLSTIRQGFGRDLVRNVDGKWQTLTKSDLLVENANGFRGAQAQPVKHPFGRSFFTRCNSGMDDSGFIHEITVSHMQHIVNKLLPPNDQPQGGEACPGGTCSPSLFIVCPHSDYLDGSNIIQHMIHESMLDIDSS